MNEVVTAAMSTLDMELFIRDVCERKQESEKTRLAARAYIPDYRDMHTLLRYRRQTDASIERYVGLLGHSQRASILSVLEATIPQPLSDSNSAMVEP